MSVPPPPGPLPDNRLLAALPAGERAHLDPLLTPVRIARHQLLYTSGTPLARVWFPQDAVVSLLSVGAGGPVMDMTVVGAEGLVGLPLFFGLSSDAHTAVGQVPGEALMLEAGPFQAAVAHLPGLRAILLCAAQVLVLQAGQGAVCLAWHALEQRCARWLLQTADRVGHGQVALTHDLLARLLGVRRPALTLTAGRLQQAGLIAYHRGQIRIRDRAGLEAAACPCYRYLTDHTDRLLGPARLLPTPGPRA